MVSHTSSAEASPQGIRKQGKTSRRRGEAGKKGARAGADPLSSTTSHKCHTNSKASSSPSSNTKGEEASGDLPMYRPAAESVAAPKSDDSTITTQQEEAKRVGLEAELAKEKAERALEKAERAKERAELEAAKKLIAEHEERAAKHEERAAKHEELSAKQVVRVAKHKERAAKHKKRAAKHKKLSRDRGELFLDSMGRHRKLRATLGEICLTMRPAAKRDDVKSVLLQDNLYEHRAASTMDYKLNEQLKVYPPLPHWQDLV